MRQVLLFTTLLALTLSACSPEEEFHSFEELTQNKELREKLDKACFKDGRKTDTCQNAGHAVYFCMDGDTKSACDKK